MVYAHTKEGANPAEWEPLYGTDGHAAKVAEQLASFPSPFAPEVLPEPAALWRILGLYHDMGKASKAFQNYLANGGHGTNVDHKTAAARWWWNGNQSDDPGDRSSMDFYGIMLAFAFAGHHSGLPCGVKKFADDFYALDIQEALDALPLELRKKPELPQLRDLPGVTNLQDAFFSFCLMTRMLHSSLVDADWLATEAYMDPEAARQRADATAAFESLDTLSARLENHLATVEAGATGRINALRQETHAACHAAAEQERGVYKLNVPTGGGKTLSSLSFALAHAHRHGMSRVIYVIPYTSIIDQTAEEFRKVLGAHNVVEHHSNLGEDRDTEQNRYATENWDAPLIVTTAVQFFESLFACGNSRCRKVHNIANSVVIFDEAQTLPVNLLRPCLAAMKSLQRICGCTLVLCTATQPNLENRDGFDIGWEAGYIHSLIGEDLEKRLAAGMKRVELTELGPLDTAELIEHLQASGATSALIIVNLTRQAQDLHAALENAMGEAATESLYHLSARMCPAHRRKVLETVRTRLAAGEPTVLVATRVVEAGVDISFPVVYRDRCGLDSLAQSAGRCNRHGETDKGRVYSYEAKEEEYRLPEIFVGLKAGVYARVDTVQEGDDPFDPAVVDRYFQVYYDKRGERSHNWDEGEIMEKVYNEKASGDCEMMACWDFPAMCCNLIPGGQTALLMPYGEQAEELRARLLSRNREGLAPTREDYRAAQQLTVSIYPQEWEKLKNHCECIHEDAGLYMLATPEAYSPQTGLQRELGAESYVL